MAKSKIKSENKPKSALVKVWAFIAWLTGILVSLAVGFGMINEVLPIPNIPLYVTKIAGYIVVVLVIIGAILAVIDKIRS